MDASFDWQGLTTLTSVVVAIFGAVVAISTARNSAGKSEVENLRGIIAEMRTEIDRLRDDNDKLRKRVNDLETENNALRQATVPATRRGWQ